MAIVECIDREGSRWKINTKEILAYDLEEDRSTGQRYGVMSVRSMTSTLHVSNWETVWFELRYRKLLGEVTFRLPEL